MKDTTTIYIEIQANASQRLESVYEALRGLPVGRFVVTISKYKKKRSLSQQGYYFKVIIPAVRQGLIDRGFEADKLDNEATHELLKTKFLKEDLPNEHGEFVTIVKSTTNLSTVDFMAYVEDIYRWSSDFLSVVIPEPNTQQQMF